VPASTKIHHNRADVIARAEREFAELDAVVRRLRSEDWDQKVPRPETRLPWSVKDAICHVVYWKEHTCRVLRGERRPPETRGLDIEALNRYIYDRWHDRPVDEVVAWHRAVHEDVLQTLRTIPDARISGRPHDPGWPIDFDGHSSGHRVKDVEAALGDR
jgi:hypothetical protein